MYIIFIPLIYAYVINKDELKVIYYSNQIFDYSLTIESLQQTNIKQIQGNYEDIQNIISLSTLNYPSISILTTNHQQQNSVLNLQQDENQKYVQQEQKYKQQCNSVAQMTDQYVLSCGNQLVLQNGTSFEISQNALSIHFVDDCLVIVQKDKLLVIEDQAEYQYSVKFVDVIVTQRQIYILTNTDVIIWDNNNQTEYVSHNCSTPPTFFAVFVNYIYVQCESLKKIFNDGKILELKSLKATTALSQTNRYLIVDKRQVYNIENDQLFYTSTTDLYSLNYDDDVISFSNTNINILRLRDITIVKANDEKQFSINDKIFTVVDYGLQPLPTKTKNQYFYKYFIAGNDTRVSKNATEIPPLKGQNKFTQNQIVYTSFNYKLNDIIILYSQNKTLYATLCSFELTDQVDYECKQSEVLASNLSYPITNTNGVYDPESDQVIVGFQQGSDLIIYLNGEIYVQEYSNFSYILGQKYLLMYSTMDCIIYRLIQQGYELELNLKLSVKVAAVSNDQIFLIDGNNTLIILQDSVNGLQFVHNETIKDPVLQCFYINGQLFLIQEQKILIYQSRILRGTIYAEILGEKQYTQTTNYFYIRNSTHIYQFTTDQQLSLSSLLQRVIHYSNMSAISLVDYELLFITKQYVAYPNNQEFIPSGLIGNESEYFHISSEQITFVNSFNESITTAIPVVATQLQLAPTKHNNTLEIKYSIPTSELFTGPISNITTINSSIQIQQRIYQNRIFLENIIDLIYIGNSSTVVFTQYQLKHCNDSCQVMAYINDVTCKHLQQDQIAVYLICEKQIFYANKSDLQVVSNLTTNLKNPIIWKFDHFRMGIILQNQNKSKVLQTYSNIFTYKNQKIIDDLMDFVFNEAVIYVLTKSQLIIMDLNLTIINSIDLLQLIKVTFTDTEFRQIIKLTNSTFIISTNNALIYKLLIDQNNKQITNWFINVPEATLLNIQLINQDILVASYLKGDQVVAVFYEQNIKLVPYFQAITLGSKLYLKQNSEYTFVIRNPQNQTQLIEMNIHYSLIIRGYETQFIMLVAQDFDLQNATQLAKLVIETFEEPHEDENQFIWIVYVFLGAIGLLICLFLVRYVRRYQILKNMQFVEDKQSQEQN